MKFIPYEVKTGAENMQIDSDLLEWAIQNNFQEPIFRLYGWSPACVSLGRNQSDEFLDRELLKKYNIDVVRRLTGGRALLHDNELTYSYICPVKSLENGENVVESYKGICQFLITRLRKLGIYTNFGPSQTIRTKFNYCMQLSTGADLCWEGKKLIGSAQCRKNGYILQHGSILIDYNKELIDEIFKDESDFSHIACINDIDKDLTKDDLIKIFNC